MHLPYVDITHKHNPLTFGPSGAIHDATPVEGPNDRPDDYMPVFSGVLKAPDVAGRLNVRPSNDNPAPRRMPVRAFVKRTVVQLYCRGFLPLSLTQCVVNFAQAWEA
jgi:hypothetical protein